MLDTKIFRTADNIDQKNVFRFYYSFLSFITVLLLLITVATLYGQETLGELSTQMEIQGEMQNQGQGANKKPAVPKNTNQATGNQGIEKLEKTAQKLMQSMRSGKYDQADFSPVWNAVVPPNTNFSDGLNTICKPVFDQFGTPEKLGQGKMAGTNRAVFPVQFTRGTLNMTVSLDSQDKIVEWTLLTQPPPAAAAPVVLKTTPQTFANDIEPSLGEITVTFDQPMMDGNWSWTGGGETFPKNPGQPGYNQNRTICRLPVSLEPGKAYWVGINSPNAQNFKNVKGIPAKQYVILFATKDADGKPTPIPENMLKEARAINAQNNMSGTETPVTKAEQLTIGESLPKEANAPDIKDFNAFQRELNRINIETRGEEEQWLGPLDKKADLARSIDELVVAQLRFVRKLAETEHSEQTIKAIDLVIRQRQERLNKLITKLEDETRQERQQQAPRRTTTRTGAGTAGEQVQTERQNLRPQRRPRDANAPVQQY